MPAYQEIKPGDRAEKTAIVSDELIRAFAALIGDDNPVHLDDRYAAGSFFKRRVAHGAIALSFVSAVLGVQLPGPGTVYLSQNVKFTAPVYPGDQVAVRVEVLEKKDPGRKIRLRTWAEAGEGRLVLDGEAWVMLRN
jgi:3-hydroxybutyryl-CoA dehydratase